MSGAGENRSFEQTLSQTLKISVSAVFPDGSATLRQVISVVTLDMDTPSGKVSYDSAKPPATPAATRASSTFAGTQGIGDGCTISLPSSVPLSRDRRGCDSRMSPRSPARPRP